MAHPNTLAANFGEREATEGKAAAIVVYILYLAGVFSAHTLSPIGVIVAYASRGGASPWVRAHLDSQIRMFWTVLFWIAGLALLGWATLLIFGLGLLVWLAIAPIAVVLTLWFGVKSVLGLLRLAGDKAP